MATQTPNPYAQNAMARQNLLQTGIAMTKRLQPVTGTLGGSIRIPLLRMGIMTGVMLQFTLTATAAGSPAVSPMGPHNLAKQVTYTDFAGVNRTKTSGWQLWAAQCFKQNDILGAIASMVSPAGGLSPTYNYDTNILNQPIATGAQNTYFSLYVPMAYDAASDLTGAVLTQTNVGEHYITVDLPSSLVGSDPYAFPYTAGTFTGVTVTVEAFQHYIQPQFMTADSLPMIDLSTVYGFEGGYQNTANIAAGQSSYINLPNNRSILSTLLQYENGGAFTANGADISAITLLANSNTNFRELTPRMIRESMRNMMNSDMVAGTYFISSRRQPILTYLYANVQLKVDIAAASAGVTQLVSQYEVQYPSGSPLPGITG